jgi:L-fuculose-phosphate aldolase
MANHGAVTVGPDPDTAVEASLLLEWACGLYLRVAPLGVPPVLDEKAQQAVIEQALKLPWPDPEITGSPCG